MSEETNETNEINERIVKVNIDKEMRSAYIDYSMSVIVSRALPDVRDRSEEHTSELQSR